MDQSDRIAELDRFKSGEINILVASDVAARGLDVKDVSHVFNFDVPWQPDDYIHRIGRTGRAGAKGIAITLATREDADQVAAIEKLLGQKIRRLGATATEFQRKSEPEKKAQPQRKAEQQRKSEPKREHPKPSPAKAEQPRRPEKPKEPVDADSDWNGPMPSFLSVSAS
jgi:superfamily II DNA/RNA helicase